MGEKKSAEELVAAGKSKNTERGMKSTIRHYENHFGRLLPAGPGDIEDYLVEYQNRLSPRTLAVRLSHLTTWHQEQEYPIPTRTPRIEALLKGIRAEHGTKPKQASPLKIEHITAIVNEQELRYRNAPEQSTHTKRQRAIELGAIRNKALFLLGFWCAFREDELIRLTWRDVTFNDVGMELFLAKSKGDRKAEGRTWKLTSLEPPYLHLCPTSALIDWHNATSQPDDGPVFSKVSQWGEVSDEAFKPNAVNELIKSVINKTPGLSGNGFSSHSLRRGLANFAIQNKTPLVDLVTWIKWNNFQSARPYLEDQQDLPNQLLKGLSDTTIQNKADSLPANHDI